MQTAAIYSTTDLVNQFLKKNRQYWETFTSGIQIQQDKSIIVDFMVGHVGYLIGNGVIAKYLQQQLKTRVYALVTSDSAELESALAQSFCFDGTIKYDTPIPLNLNINWNDVFGNKTIEQQRKRLLEFSANDIVLGDLAYDTYIRNTGMGTVETIDGQVLATLQQTIRDFVLYDSTIKKLNAIASVQGHIVYSQYGTLARAMINSGGTVYGKKYASGPLTVRRYNNLDEVKKHEFTFSRAEFDEVFAKIRPRATEHARNYMQNRLQQKLTHTLDGAEAYASNKKLYSKAELTQTLGMDADKPIVVIMSHVFPDAPHCCGWSLYDDFVQWMRETLKIIQDIDHVNWVIKPHPDNKHYNSKHSVAEEAKQYIAQHQHIKIAPEDLNTACLYDMAHAVVTVSGTAALEFPAMGIPAVNAGDSCYTGLGFTHEPKNIDDYQTLLKTIDQLQPLDQETQDRALTCIYMYYFLARVKCDLIPDIPDVFWIQRDENEIWREANDLIDKFAHENDDAYRNFLIQLQRDTDHMFNFDQLEG